MNNDIKNYIKEQNSMNEIFLLVMIYWKRIITSSFLFSITGIIIAINLPQLYQGTQNIQIAKVIGIDVTERNTIQYKLKSLTYFSEETLKICEISYPDIDNNKNIQISVIPETSIINIKYKNNNLDLLKNCIDRITIEILNSQNKDAQVIIDLKLTQLKNLNDSLFLLENYLKFLESKNIDKLNFSEQSAIAYSSSITTLIVMISDLRGRINQLNISLLEPETKNAYLISPIYFSKIPIIAKQIKIILGFFIFGAVFMIGIIYIKNEWIRIKFLK